MKIFLKEEWFKVLLILLGFYAVTLFYLSKDMSHREVMTNPLLTNIATSTIQTVISTTTQEKPTAEKVIVATKTPQRILSQVKALDDFLEYDVVGAGVYCIVYSTYNNLVAYPSPDVDLKTMFPESKDTYESKCRSSYVEMNMNNRFVAEPELVELRKIISEYADAVHTFSAYVLDGGYSNSVINAFDKKAKTQRQDAREQVLAVKRKYNIQ